MIHLKETTNSKGLLLKERKCSPMGSIFFPLKVASLRIENNFKGH